MSLIVDKLEKESKRNEETIVNSWVRCLTKNSFHQDQTTIKGIV